LPFSFDPYWTPQWLHCRIIGTGDELRPGPRIETYSPDGWRGLFSDLLDRAGAYLRVDGSTLVTGPLIASFWRWAVDQPAKVAPSAWASALDYARGFGPHPDSAAAPTA
jgi:hypothetical protein